MRITLVTWKGAGNYGTCLQAYALFMVLCNLGHQTSLLTYIPERYTIRLFVKWLLSCLGILKLKDAFSYGSMSIQEKKLINFQNGVFKETFIYTKCQENALVKETDCFVTGSDQIWNTYYNYSPGFFLSFAGTCKRIAYASSIGTNSIKDTYKNKVKELLLKFSHIGVREKEAVRVLSELTGRKDIVQVLDPTFLLTPDDWRKMAKYAEYEVELPKDYILCYLIGNNSWYKEQLIDVKQHTGIEDIIIIPSTETPDFTCEGATIYSNASPVEFIDLLSKAKMVCTDSFHATALSINHSIPFVEFMRFQDGDKNSQNSRIYDLLEHYKLMNRIYQKESDRWISNISYHAVQEILGKDRKFSMEYLSNAIEH